MYDVSNPHPGYGTDPNILNEFGHTAYPKWVATGEKTDKGHEVRVLVKDEAEETEVTGKKADNKAKPKPEGWSR